MKIRGECWFPLTQGKWAVVDLIDADKVMEYSWRVLKTVSGNFYAIRDTPRRTGRKTIYLHSEILGVREVDHKDGDGLNCRRNNLRPATPLQQAQGFRRKPPGSSSKFRGVCWRKRDSTWAANIREGGKQIHLGYYPNEIDAAKAYNQKAREAGFAKEALNFL